MSARKLPPVQANYRYLTAWDRIMQVGVQRAAHNQELARKDRAPIDAVYWNEVYGRAGKRKWRRYVDIVSPETRELVSKTLQEIP